MSDPKTIVQAFASALDADDFEALLSLLARDCQYDSPRGALAGPDAIVASYKEASEWARSKIQSVRYESTVRVEPAGDWIITFIDRLEHDGLRHTYACEQVVSLNASGQIERIRHRELDGEREAVDAFLRNAGIER